MDKLGWINFAWLVLAALGGWAFNWCRGMENKHHEVASALKTHEADCSQFREKLVAVAESDEQVRKEFRDRMDERNQRMIEQLARIERLQSSQHEENSRRQGRFEDALNALARGK